MRKKFLNKAQIKGLFEEYLEERTNSFWNLTYILSDVLWQIDCAEDASDAAGVAYDYEGNIRAALAEFSERVVMGMVEEEAEEEADEGLDDGDGEEEEGSMSNMMVLMSRIAGTAKGFFRMPKGVKVARGAPARRRKSGDGALEYKVARSYIKSIEGRKVTGIFAVHGNIDSYDDVSYPGSFQKTIQERGPQGSGKVMCLWNHNLDMFAGPPVAVVKGLREVGRDELPDAVLKAAPDATGGVEVTREYLDTPRGNEVLAGIKSGAISEMSYAYDPVKYDFSERDGKNVRNLREQKLYEVSDVLWGANDATLASKGLLPSIEMMVKQLQARVRQLKAGARNSADDTKLINAIHTAVVDLGADCPGASMDGEEEEDETGESGKSRAAVETTLTLKRADEFLLDTRINEFLAGSK